MQRLKVTDQAIGSVFMSNTHPLGFYRVTAALKHAGPSPRHSISARAARNGSLRNGGESLVTNQRLQVASEHSGI